METAPTPPATLTEATEKITREYHRRRTHHHTAPDPVTRDQVDGELMSLRAAIGMLLGGEVRHGASADRLGEQHYRNWLATTPEAEQAACHCTVCQVLRPAPDPAPRAGH